MDDQRVMIHLLQDIKFLLSIQLKHSNIPASYIKIADKFVKNYLKELKDRKKKPMDVFKNRLK